MFGLRFFIATLESTNGDKRYEKRVLVSHTNEVYAELSLIGRLVDENFCGKRRPDGDTRLWRLDGQLIEIDLTPVINGKGGYVILSNEQVAPVNPIVVTPATPEESITFKGEQDIDPDYFCPDCEELNCRGGWDCLAYYDDEEWES